jgi:hypothetical protein
MSAEVAAREAETNGKIDWLDMGFPFCVGLVYFPLKVIEVYCDDPGSLGGSLGDLSSILCIAYILWRAERQPWKLREWGLTTPITGTAFAFFAGFLALTIVSIGCTGLALSGSLSFELSYVFRMIDYVSGAFPQQFLFFAVGVANLEKFSLLRGHWRLPLLLGALFCLGHCFMPIPLLWGLPVPVLVTFPLGFFATWYFLRFRTIIPLVAIHAIGFILLVNWIDKYL